jgi:hypothetical protein
MVGPFEDDGWASAGTILLFAHAAGKKVAAQFSAGSAAIAHGLKAKMKFFVL